MSDVKDFGPYSAKEVKSFMGMDGAGYNCTLYRNRKKIAFCIDEGRGGEVHINWVTSDRDEEKRLLVSHVKSLPKVKSEYCAKDLEIDEGWFVEELVEKFEQEKDIRKVRRQCNEKILYRTPDQKKEVYYVFSAPYSKTIADALRKKYGQGIEIFNEVFEQGNVPSVFV